MKRWTGTLLYHVIAFFANAFFLVFSFWLNIRISEGPREPGDDYFGIVQLFPAILTIVPATLGTWLLRRLARRFRWTRWWQWLLAGVVIGCVMIQALGRAGLAVESAHFSLAWQSVKSAVMFALLLGPMLFTFQPWWLPLPPLASTAAVLFLVQRAFGWQDASNRQK